MQYKLLNVCIQEYFILRPFKRGFEDFFLVGICNILYCLVLYLFLVKSHYFD